MDSTANTMAWRSGRRQELRELFTVGVLCKLLSALNHYGVPLAAAVLGWIFGGQFLLWVLYIVASDSSFAFLVFGAQALGAILLFLVANRYLN